MAEVKCVFCKIADKTLPAKIVFENDELLAFADLNPKAPAHFLIIPKRHIEKVSDLTESDAAIVGRMALAANRLARQYGIDSSGYRIVLNCNKDAGQEVFHLHMHLMGGRKFSWPPG
jgi:histidine triad (HIT) family protein